MDLAAIAELKGVRQEGDGLTVGAMTTHAAVGRRPHGAGGDPRPGQAGRRESATRRCATAAPSAAPSPTPTRPPTTRRRCSALGATVKTNQREIAADDFFTALFETALEPGELIVSVHFPKPEAAGYAKFDHPASRYAIVGVMVAKTGGGVRVAVTRRRPKRVPAERDGAGPGGQLRARCPSTASPPPPTG